MTDEEKRIAIAEACGWENIWESENLGGSILAGKHPVFKIQQAVPDYLNDLNAMHAAEKVLPDDDHKSYRAWLVVVCNGRHWNAAAAQRADAFLKCLGLLRD